LGGGLGASSSTNCSKRQDLLTRADVHGRGERRQTSTTDLDVPVRLPLEIALTGVERWQCNSTV